VIREGGPAFDPARAALVLEDPASQFVTGSLAEEIEFVLEGMAIGPVEIARRRDEALEATATGTFASRDPRRLSSGEQAACLLAVALASSPQLLLLDDPFIHLDPAWGRRIWETLRTHVASGRIPGVLVATHDTERSVEADLAGILGNGTLIAWGDPAVLLRGMDSPPLEPPLGVVLERALPEKGLHLPRGGIDLESLAERIASVLRS
jgi:energy-coupling factor transporter ATP-binding protein EcfA2